MAARSAADHRTAANSVALAGRSAAAAAAAVVDHAVTQARAEAGGFAGAGDREQALSGGEAQGTFREFADATLMM